MAQGQVRRPLLPTPQVKAAPQKPCLCPSTEVIVLPCNPAILLVGEAGAFISGWLRLNAHSPPVLSRERGRCSWTGVLVTEPRTEAFSNQSWKTNCLACARRVCHRVHLQGRLCYTCLPTQIWCLSPSCYTLMLELICCLGGWLWVPGVQLWVPYLPPTHSQATSLTSLHGESIPLSHPLCVFGWGFSPHWAPAHLALF